MGRTLEAEEPAPARGAERGSGPGPVGVVGGRARCPDSALRRSGTAAARAPVSHGASPEQMPRRGWRLPGSC